MKFIFPYKTKKEIVSVGGLSLEMESLESLDATIDSYFAEYESSKREELFEDLCPYFGVLWPSSIALANYCVKHKDEIPDLTIELGCGLAIPSLVIAKLGKKVLATDFHPDVPVFLERNIRSNDIKNLEYKNLDWRSWDQATFSLVLASDVLYDRTQVTSLLDFLDKNLCKGGQLWVTDPGRAYWERFSKEAKLRGHHVKEEIFESVFFMKIRKVA